MAARLTRQFLFALLGVCMLSVSAHSQEAPTLLARRATLAAQLADSPFHRPLHLESGETDDSLKGEIYAEIAQPFGKVAASLRDMEQWCDMLILHLNVKSCRVSGGNGSDGVLTVMIGSKHEEPLENAFRVDFEFHSPAAGGSYVKTLLSAAKGPLGTSDYRIMLEAVPLDARRSFLHLSYSYAFGTSGRIAMNAYLATIGRNKVGFSVTGMDDHGKPVYIGGVRGAVERNTMRYYLAIETYLATADLAPAQALEKRLADSYAATEAYATQLHELPRDEYLQMKRHEVERQRQ